MLDGLDGPIAPGDERSHRERMLAGDLYRGGDPLPAEDHRRAMRLLARFNRSGVDDLDHRRSILGELLGAVGPGAVIRPPFHCDYGTQIAVGAGTFVNFGLVALDPAPITVGDDVQIGPNVQLLTPTHPLDPALRRAGWEGAQPITIADNVWLGGGVIVLPGVSIGEHSVGGGGGGGEPGRAPRGAGGGQPGSDHPGAVNRWRIPDPSLAMQLRGCLLLGN